MSPTDWAALAVSIATLVTAFATAVRWLVRHYLMELKPNGGSTLSDRVTRVERRLEDIYTMLQEQKPKPRTRSKSQ